MSQENMEIVQRAYEALNGGDLESLRELVAPEIVIDYSRRLVDPFVLRGTGEQGWDAAQTELLEAWDTFPAREVQELIPADDKVLAYVRVTATGRGSGIQLDVDVAEVWKFEDGKPVDFTYFGENRAEALQAVGLQE